MEILPEIIKYIEDNQDLLDTDEGIHELVDKSPNSQNLFDVLRSAGLLSNYEQLCDNYIKDLKKHTVDSAIGLNIEPCFTTLRNKSFPPIITASINNDIGDNIELQLNSDYRFIMTGTNVSIKRGNEQSAVIHVWGRSIYDPISLNELSHKTELQNTANRFNSFIQDIDSSVIDCINSFDYKLEAKRLVDSIVPEMENLMSSILGYSKIIVKDDKRDSFLIQPKSKTGTLINTFHICYSKPITVDKDALLTTAERYLKNYKIQYDKNQARKAAKQAELAANPDKKIITRKEINQAIDNSGVYVRDDFVYTNKHKTITTYKYAFNNLSQADCDKIKDELVKIGANVKDVTCEQGWWGGHGAYISLFIRIYNS